MTCSKQPSPVEYVRWFLALCLIAPLATGLFAFAAKAPDWSAFLRRADWSCAYFFPSGLFAALLTEDAIRQQGFPLLAGVGYCFYALLLFLGLRFPNRNIWSVLLGILLAALAIDGKGCSAVLWAATSNGITP